jgi:hypothetical protein
MKKRMLGVAAFVLAVSLGAMDFTQTMTAEERKAAGLDKLTPTELARLQAAVERYKSGEVAVVKQAAEQEVARAEARVRAAETRQTAAEKPAEAKKPGWFGALVTLKKAGEKPEKAEALEMPLAGDLQSFRGRRRFELQDGQVWRMIEDGSYAGPVLKSPTVSITPGIFGVYWLQIREAALRVKVEPVKLD